MSYKIKIRGPFHAWFRATMEALCPTSYDNLQRLYVPCARIRRTTRRKLREWCMTSSYLFSRFRRGIRMDENERITLRLEKENLELIDAFLKGSTSHGNRSQLVRDAVQAYIQTIREGGDTVKIRIPRYYLELIDRLVADGYFLSREHAVVRSIEEWFTRDRVKEIQDHRTEVDKMTGKVVSVSTGDKDGVIPP